MAKIREPLREGFEWGVLRWKYPDRFDQLYRHGFVQQGLWILAAAAGCFYGVIKAYAKN